MGWFEVRIPDGDRRPTSVCVKERRKVGEIWTGNPPPIRSTDRCVVSEVEVHLNTWQHVEVGRRPPLRGGRNPVSVSVEVYDAASDVFIGGFESQTGLQTNATELYCVHQVAGRNPFDQIEIVRIVVCMGLIGVDLKEVRIACIGIKKRPNLSKVSRWSQGIAFVVVIRVSKAAEELSHQESVVWISRI